MFQQFFEPDNTLDKLEDSRLESKDPRYNTKRYSFATIDPDVDLELIAILETTPPAEA